MAEKCDKDVKRMSLAYRDLTHLTEYVKKKIKLKGVEVLDLSYNHFFGLKSLNGLTNIKTLILDGNLLESHIIFPPFPNLEILWVNKNNIDNLPVFVETLSESFPNLRFLSMMNNPAAPSYFNGGSVRAYKDYRLYCENLHDSTYLNTNCCADEKGLLHRIYVISRLPKLEFLDDEAISEKEKTEAHEVYQAATHRKVKST